MSAIDSVRQRHEIDPELEKLKVPPHSNEAEQNIIGGLMLDNSAWDRVADKVLEEDFYQHRHRLIFRAIAQLEQRESPFDVITVAEALAELGWLEEAGGRAYIFDLARETPSAVNIEAYAKIVRDRSVLRQLLTASGEIADSAYHPKGREVQPILEAAEQRIFHIADQYRREGMGFKAIKPLLTGAVNRIEELYHRDDPITGLPTGYADFDEKTSGLQSTDLIIIAGRPSMGKTSFAMNIVEHVAIDTKRPVAVYSMEMSGEQLALRMISSLGRIDQQRVRTGKLSDEEFPRLTCAVNLLAETKLFIDETPALTPTELRARARRLKREQKDLALIVVDYLQLMQTAGGSESRVAEISEISRSLKALAKELHVPVIALSQLNRNLEQRPNKRPVMSDIRESGSIEQDADVIVFIYRDEVYNQESPDKGIAEIIIGKQRNGPLGTVRLTFLGQYTRFENFSPNSGYEMLDYDGSGVGGYLGHE